MIKTTRRIAGTLTIAAIAASSAACGGQAAGASPAAGHPQLLTAGQVRTCLAQHGGTVSASQHSNGVTGFTAHLDVTFPATDYDVTLWHDNSEAQAAEHTIEGQAEAYAASYSYTKADIDAAIASSDNAVYFLANQNKQTSTSRAAFADCFPS